MHPDPLDIGDPQRKAWEEFRAGFAACFLQIWTLEELDELAPDYFRDLDSRLFVGFMNAEGLAELDPDYDGAVPVQSPTERSVWFIPKEEAEDLFDQLFPHGHGAASDKTPAYGLALVGLHSALEAYAVAAGIALDRKLPLAILAHLRRRTPKQDLGSEVADALTEFHETRRIIVHNRGIVDERYINAVKYNRMLEGERKPIDFGIALGFGRVVWRVAKAIQGDWSAHSA